MKQDFDWASPPVGIRQMSPSIQEQDKLQSLWIGLKVGKGKVPECYLGSGMRCHLPQVEETSATRQGKERKDTSPGERTQQGPAGCQGPSRAT